MVWDKLRTSPPLNYENAGANDVKEVLGLKEQGAICRRCLVALRALNIARPSGAKDGQGCLQMEAAAAIC